MKCNTLFLPRAFSTSFSNLKKINPEQLTKKIKNASSQNWLSRQLSDPYIEKAKMMNYRCRSAFKLIEIDNKYKILHPGYIVIDCGASPGSWMQVAVQRVNAGLLNKNEAQGKVLAIDRQLIYPIEGAVTIGNMDFTLPQSQEKLLDVLEGQKVDSVISDMAPNATGIRDLDNENITELCYSAVRFALKVSKEGASVLVKLWQCGGSKKLEDNMKKFYENVRIVKPKSSRSDSTEIFILGKGFKGLKES